MSHSSAQLPSAAGRQTHTHVNIVEHSSGKETDIFSAGGEEQS